MKKEKLRLKLLEKRKKEFSRCAEQILEINDKIDKISSTQKQKRMDEKNLRISTGRITSHQHMLHLDRTRRPSDRGYEIRNYSKMDMDVWRYDQLRDWFQTYATDPEPYNYIPSQEGYTLRIDDD